MSDQLSTTEGLTSEEIATAYADGRLDAYLAKRRSPLAPAEDDRRRATREVLGEMPAEQVADAYRRGALDKYLGSRTR